MAILRSQSSRFVRSLNYTMPEYRPAAPQGVKTKISLAAPTGAGRKNENRGSRSGERV